MGQDALRKGILDSYTHVLTPAQRVEYERLRRAGLGDIEARDLAVAVVNATLRVGKTADQVLVEHVLQLAKSAYSDAYVQSAKQKLSDWQHKQISLDARNRSGGKQSGLMRRGKKDPSKALMLAQRKIYEDAIAAIDQHVQKAVAPTMQQLHLPGVTGRLRRKKKRTAMAVAKSVELDDSVLPLVNAQRLVAGIDFELSGGRSLEDTRALVSDSLSFSPMYYDGSWPLWWHPQPVPGVQLDVGRGIDRAKGMLGVDADLNTLDYGTIFHDVRMGLPVEAPRTVSALRLSDADASWTDQELNKVLMDAQTALAFGGRILWESPNNLKSRVNLQLLPGLSVTEDSTLPDGRHQTVLERVQREVPMAYGADAQNWGRKEETPADLALVYQALTAAEHPQLLMANLVHKREQVPHPEALHQPIVQDAPYKQIVWGLVYEPDVVDSQGDYMTAEDIETAAHQAMRDGIHICLEHNGIPINAAVVESFVAPVDFTMEGRNGAEAVRKGSWMMGVHIADKPVWDGVLRGDFQGFSMGGFAAAKSRFGKSATAGIDSSDSREANVAKGKRLKGVVIKENSLVRRGANGKNWAVVKSATQSAEDEAAQRLAKGAQSIRPQVVAMMQRLKKADGEDGEQFTPHEKVAATAMGNIGAQLKWSREQWMDFVDTLIGDDDEDEEDEQGDTDDEDDEDEADYEDDGAYQRDIAMAPVGKAKANAQTPNVGAEAEHKPVDKAQDEPSQDKGPAFGVKTKTASGKNIDRNDKADATAHPDYSAADHSDAAESHGKLAQNYRVMAEDAPQAAAKKFSAMADKHEAIADAHKEAAKAKGLKKSGEFAPKSDFSDHSNPLTNADAAASAGEHPVSNVEQNESAEALRKSHDDMANQVKELVAKAAKQDSENAELRGLIKRQEDRRVMNETLAEVERDFPHIAGTVEEKANLLKSLRENEALKSATEALEKSWRAANAQLAGSQTDSEAPARLFAVEGTGISKSVRGGAQAELDNVISQAIAKGDTRTKEQIYVATLEAHPELAAKIGMGGV